MTDPVTAILLRLVLNAHQQKLTAATPPPAPAQPYDASQAMQRMLLEAAARFGHPAALSMAPAPAPVPAAPTPAPMPTPREPLPPRERRRDYDDYYDGDTRKRRCSTREKRSSTRGSDRRPYQPRSKWSGYAHYFAFDPEKHDANKLFVRLCVPNGTNEEMCMGQYPHWIDGFRKWETETVPVRPTDRFTFVVFRSHADAAEAIEVIHWFLLYSFFSHSDVSLGIVYESCKGLSIQVDRAMGPQVRSMTTWSLLLFFAWLYLLFLPAQSSMADSAEYILTPKGEEWVYHRRGLYGAVHYIKGACKCKDNGTSTSTENARLQFLIPFQWAEPRQARSATWIKQTFEESATEILQDIVAGKCNVTASSATMQEHKGISESAQTMIEAAVRDGLLAQVTDKSKSD